MSTCPAIPPLCPSPLRHCFSLLHDQRTGRHPHPPLSARQRGKPGGWLAGWLAGRDASMLPQCCAHVRSYMPIYAIIAHKLAAVGTHCDTPLVSVLQRRLIRNSRFTRTLGSFAKPGDSPLFAFYPVATLFGPILLCIWRARRKCVAETAPLRAAGPCCKLLSRPAEAPSRRPFVQFVPLSAPLGAPALNSPYKRAAGGQCVAG